MEDLDLGSGHSIRFIVEDDEVTALIESHKNYEDNSPCGGMIPLGEDEWIIRSLEPLTVMPSVDCDVCSSHGVIINGEWHETQLGQHAHQVWEDIKQQRVETQSQIST